MLYLDIKTPKGHGKLKLSGMLQLGEQQILQFWPWAGFI